MNCEEIYIRYGDYPTLEDKYPLVSDFAQELQDYVTNQNLGFISSETTLQNKLRVLMSTFAYPIYDEYYDDRLAYEEKEVFMKRLVNTLSRKINRWYIQKKIEEDLIDNVTLEKFISNGGTHSTTNENASMGSAVIQKSASTPTGITHNASSEQLDVELSHDTTSDTTSMEITDGYDDKYTNFVGKTDGLHRNEVDRDTDITRTSNYGLALEILEKIPYSYIEDVLKEVSQHFIQVY